MKVYISPLVMNESANFQILNRVFYFFEEKKHWLCIDTLEDLTAIKNSDWFLSLAEYQREIYTEILNNAFDSSINNKEKPYTFEIQNLYFYLSEPAYLIVENEISDVAFFQTIMRCFPKESKKIKEALAQRPEWLIIKNAGGKGQMEKIAKHLKERNESARIFIFRDSDKRFPTNENNDVGKLEDFCKKNDISFHILQKREIENYLPLSALATLTDKKEVFEAYKQLNTAQQDFYDMEKGFGGKNEIPNDCEGLWDNIDKKKPNFQHLRNGFCGNNGKRLLETLFQNQDLITKESLLARCQSTGQNELKELLGKIVKIL